MLVQPDWPPTFNVIYVPGSVHTLVDFARSLVMHSSFHYRLVSNACDRNEEAFLAQQAARNPRLEFASLDSRQLLPHGEALQRLFERERAPYFACMDSDIFARGPFLDDAQALLADHAALFSGLPTWLAPDERVMPRRFVFMSGRFSHTDDGRCLGVSYCAVYRRAELERVMTRTGTTFHARHWSELTPRQRALLTRMKLEKRRYDTIKLVNLMLADAGSSLLVRSEPNLMHVGALSSAAARPSRLTARVIARLTEIAQSTWPSSIPRRRALERKTTRNLFNRRRLVEDYVQHVLAGGACDGGPASSFPPTVQQQIVEMGHALRALRARG